MDWVRRQSLTVAATYIIVAGLWIILSDRVLIAAVPETAVVTLAILQSVKGIGFVLVSGAFLYWLMERGMRQHIRIQDQYKELVELAPIAIFIQADDEVRYANAAALVLFGAESPDELLGRNIMSLITPEYHNSVRLRMAQLRATGMQVPPVEQDMIRLDGTIVRAEVAALPATWQGQPGVQVILNDLSQKRANEARLSHIITHDELTDLPNRTLLHDRLAQEIIHARRIGRSLALLVMDVARLQFINDSYGYEAGDQLLKSLANSLRESVRPGDTVARISGDQFAVLLSDLHDRSGLLTAIEKVRNSFAHTYKVSGNEVYVTLHSGAAAWPDDGDDPDALLGNAITACYRAKKSGSVETEFYAPSITAASRKRVTMELALIEAIANREFLLHYQPKVNARNGMIVGCEALIRWNSPKLGLISPIQFIPLAEETGHIQQVGDWVLREACRQMGEWKNLGLGVVPTAVNLSAPQLHQPGLKPMIYELIYEYGLTPSCLELELTESMIMGDTPRAIGVINRLRALGIKFSLDDFGTGYSSFSYLKTFRMDHLKIDISFVRDIVQSESSARITQSIIALGHGLGLKVIAEGVETVEQARLLADWDCDIFQGYYFSRPVDAAQFTRLLSDKCTYSWAAE